MWSHDLTFCCHQGRQTEEKPYFALAFSCPCRMLSCCFYCDFWANLSALLPCPSLQTPYQCSLLSARAFLPPSTCSKWFRSPEPIYGFTPILAASDCGPACMPPLRFVNSESIENLAHLSPTQNLYPSPAGMAWWTETPSTVEIGPYIPWIQRW